jgi:hypothetical protein
MKERAVLLTVTMALAPMVARADTNPQQPDEKPDPAVVELLNKPTAKLKTGIDKGTPIKDALDYIFRLHAPDRMPGVYRLAHGDFIRAGIPGVEEVPCKLAPMPEIPLGQILQLLLDGSFKPEVTYAIRGKTVVIFPGKAPAPKDLSATEPGKALALFLGQPTDAGKAGIAKDTTFEEAIETLCHNLHPEPGRSLKYVVRWRTFPAENKVWLKPVELAPVEGKPAAEVLKLLLDQVGATYVNRGDYLLITAKAAPAK